MKKLSILLSLAIVVFAVGLVHATDRVNVGNDDFDGVNARNAQDWGPVEPATHGGNYGGIDNCRCIWWDSDASGDTTGDNTWATVDMDFGDGSATLLFFRHLQGLADDGFKIYVDGTEVGEVYEVSQVEQWVWTGLVVSGYVGVKTVKFDATGNAWGSWATYGQVCFDEVQVGSEVIPRDEANWGAIKTMYR